MRQAKNIKTTKKQIVDYWAEHVSEAGLSIDFSEADKRCWRCGCQRTLERCHIVPDSLGGEDTPSNFVLLCKRCHLDNPNVADPQIMWDWLHAYAVSFYDTFWQLQGAEEYEKIYSVSLNDEFRARGLTAENEREFQELLQKQISKTSYHFGDPHLNIATLAGLYRMAFKELDRIQGRRTEEKVKAYIDMRKYF